MVCIKFENAECNITLEDIKNKEKCEMLEKKFNFNLETDLFKKIDSISMYDCVRGYIDYLNTDQENLNGLEKELVIKLVQKEDDFAKFIAKEYLLKHTTDEERIDKILAYELDGIYGLSEDCNVDDIEEFFLSRFSESEMLDYIKQHLKNTLNEVIAEIKETTYEKKMTSLKRQIKSIEERNDDYLKLINRNKDVLEKLQKDLDKLESESWLY